MAKTKTDKSFKYKGATFTVRPVNGFDQYLLQSGWRLSVMRAVAKAEGYAVQDINEAPDFIINMAYDFANLMLTTDIDGSHPVAGHDIVNKFSDSAVAKLWKDYKDALRDDSLREKWFDAFKEVNREDDDPKSENSGNDGESAA